MKLREFRNSEESFLKPGPIIDALKTYPKTIAFLVSITWGYLAMSEWQDRANNDREILNHAYSISEMSTESKILSILGTNVYGSQLEQYFRINPETPETGLVHLYGSEMESVEEARAFVQQMRTWQNPYIFSADIEWGWVQHLTVTPEELRFFWFPAELLEMRRQELEDSIWNDEMRVREVLLTHPTPSQEWLWKVYSDLNSDEEREEFLLLMSKYGESMAKLCDHIWINIIFGPVLDRVDNIDGSSPMAEQDRSYWSDFNIIRDLAIAYLSWVNQVDGVIAVPKHFVWNGVSVTDPHHDITNTNIDPVLWTAILPFRDIINFNNDLDPEASRFSWYIRQLTEANRGHLQRQQAATTQEEKDRIQITIDANNRRIAINAEYLKQSELWFLRSIFQDGIDVPVIMTSNVATNLYNDPETPTMFSENALSALSRPKNQNGLGFEWITVTDDVAMHSSHSYISSQIPYFSWYDLDALAAYRAIASGNEIVLMRHIAGNEDFIAWEISRYIQEWVDMNNDWNADVTMQQLDVVVQRVLDLKVQLWILNSVEIRGETFYVMNPEIYNPTEGQVIRDSFYSNQWPWLIDDESYENLWRENDQGNTKMLYKALKNFWITLYSTLLNDPLNRLWNERYPENDTDTRELIVIDKSARFLWRYDLETRELIDSFEIWIWKWWEGPRRVVGDHRTPAWYYQIVQKRDHQWWQENKWVPLPEYYWGEDGWMLVMTWQWTPEIAIHWWGGLGHVSNACIRVEDEMIQQLMRDVAIWSMVIITN